MSQQLNSDNLIIDDTISVAEAWNLLFGEGCLEEDVRIEEEANCDIGAGLDWGKASGFLMLNTGLFHRLKTLRISLNREVKLLLSELNLGIGIKSATACARARILEKLQLPAPEIQEHLQAILLQDDLYGEEFIPNHEILRSLLMALLNASDWEAIALTAANSVKEQIIQQITNSDNLTCNLKESTTPH
jgi:hypothetical protein